MNQITSDDLRHAHSVMARHALDTMVGTYNAGAKADGKTAPLTAADAQIAYHAQLVFAGAGVGQVTLNFYDWDDQSKQVAVFSGTGGGGVFGGGISWGTFWANMPITELIGQQGRFQANILPLVGNINLWRMDGVPVGSYAGGGIGVGGGIFGGEGSFTR